MQKGETLIEFQNRVNIVMENKELWKQKQFEEAVKLFLRMRFGEIEPETSELKKSEELIRMLRLICKSELGSIRYYVILLEEKMLR